MTFSINQKIMFRHCDPAGVVFFPRYYEMINDSIEAFFDTYLGIPFETMHQTWAVPTVAIETVFSAVSRHGDILDIHVSPIKLGRTSLQLSVTGLCEEERRFTNKSTLVSVDSNGKPMKWPTSITDKLSGYIGDQNGA